MTKGNFLLINLLILALAVTACGRAVHTDTGELAASTTGTESAPPVQTPPPQTPPVTQVPLPNMEANVAIASYIPQISDDKCQPSIPIADPFAGFTFNKKTVCASGCNFTQVIDAFKNAQPMDEIVIEAGRYTGCPRITASPVIVRAQNGMAVLDSTGCDMGIRVDSPLIKLSGFKIVSTSGLGTAIRVTSTVSFAELRDLWMEGMGGAVGGDAAADATVIVRNFKVKDVGALSLGYHTHGVITPAGKSVIVAKGVFSHHKVNSYPIASSAPHFEFLCNVAARVIGETGIVFHFDRNEKIIIRNNFIHTNASMNQVLYQYLLPAAGTSIELTDNVILLDNPVSYFFNVPAVSLSVTNNQFIGGSGNLKYSGSPIDRTTNSVYQSRGELGLPPYPALPSDWPLKEAL